MNDSLFEPIQNAVAYLSLDLHVQEMTRLAVECVYSRENIQAVSEMLAYLQHKKKKNIVSTLLWPLKEPKIFEGFDFGQLYRKQTDAL